MSKVKQVLRLHTKGISNRQIARDLGLYKETVNSYIRKIEDHQYDIEELLTLDDPVLESKLFSGNPAYKDTRFEELKKKINFFDEELSRRHVTRFTLWEEYRQDNPEGYGYSQFCYHLGQLRLAQNPGSILTFNPGEKLMVDFAGDTFPYVDRETGEIINTQVFIACLPYSGYTFVMAVPSQSSDDFLYALSTCLHHLGGCPSILVTDNLKASVTKADRYEPELNRIMEDFANHYGFVVVPTRVRKAKDKASVENEVKIVYRRVYAKLRNQNFFSIEEINCAFAEKTRQHNQTRQQQKDYCREEKFLAEEKPLLKPLPEHPFEVKYYTKLRVALNNCIFLGRDKHYYSVPYQYIGKQTDVIYTRTLVRVFIDGKCVATHRRTVGHGYTTIREHMGSSHNFYSDRSPLYYIGQAKKCSQNLHQLFLIIFEKAEVPELQYRQCDALLSLQRKTSPLDFEEACLYAIENDIHSHQSIKRVIETKAWMLEMAGEKKMATINVKHKNIRGKEYYDG